jgi:hypothetical protein
VVVVDLFLDEVLDERVKVLWESRLIKFIEVGKLLGIGLGDFFGHGLQGFIAQIMLQVVWVLARSIRVGLTFRDRRQLV